MQKADESLRPFGGVRAYVEALARQGATYGQIAARLADQTAVQISPVTVGNWLRYWDRQGETTTQESTAA